jgi:hypothetical protein
LSARQQIWLVLREASEKRNGHENLKTLDFRLALFCILNLVVASTVNKKILDSYTQTSCRQKAVGYLNLNEIFIPIPLSRVLGVGLESHRMYPFQQRQRKMWETESQSGHAQQHQARSMQTHAKHSPFNNGNGNGNGIVMQQHQNQ